MLKNLGKCGNKLTVSRSRPIEVSSDIQRRRCSLILVYRIIVLPSILTNVRQQGAKDAGLNFAGVTQVRQANHVTECSSVEIGNKGLEIHLFGVAHNCKNGGRRLSSRVR